MRGNGLGRNVCLTSESIHGKLGEVGVGRVGPNTCETKGGTVLEGNKTESCGRNFLVVKTSIREGMLAWRIGLDLKQPRI